ncbi:putative quinol monooxygenase [Maritalea sp.]|uniref:putative quinol monooxygenase n=1 Tax=Maritalea sp. TaxID=2003361 RepID=UPI003EF3D24D
MTDMIYLNGHIDVPLDRVAAVEAALPKHIELTLAEPGCISFVVVPSTQIDGRFKVAELFVDRAAFEAHQERTKASAWHKITDGIPREYTIREGE